MPRRLELRGQPLGLARGLDQPRLQIAGAAGDGVPLGGEPPGIALVALEVRAQDLDRLQRPPLSLLQLQAARSRRVPGPHPRLGHAFQLHRLVARGGQLPAGRLQVGAGATHPLRQDFDLLAEGGQGHRALEGHARHGHDRP